MQLLRFGSIYELFGSGTNRQIYETKGGKMNQYFHYIGLTVVALIFAFGCYSAYFVARASMHGQSIVLLSHNEYISYMPPAGKLAGWKK